MHDADGGELQQFRTIAIENEGNGGDETACRQKPGIGGIAAHEMRLSAERKPDHDQHGGNRQQHDFQQEALRRAYGQGFTEKGVKAPGNGERDGNPWQAARMPGEDGHRNRHEADGGDLRRIEFFLQQYGTEEDAEQRIDEIAERGIKCAARADRPDVDAPVDADERSRKTRHRKHLRTSQRRTDFSRTPEHDQHHRCDRHRPDDAMHDDLDR